MININKYSFVYLIYRIMKIKKLLILFFLPLFFLNNFSSADVISHSYDYQKAELVRKVPVRNLYNEKYQTYKLLEFIFAYLLTILSETFLLWLIAKNFIKGKPTTKKIILTWLLCSWITLPMLWYVFPLFLWNWIFYGVFWEILVLIIESIIIKYMLNLSRIKSLLLSFICNLFSFLLWAFITSSDIKENIRNLLKAIFYLVFLILVFLYSAKRIKELKEKNQIIMLSFFILAMVLLAFIWLALIEYWLFR